MKDRIRRLLGQISREVLLTGARVSCRKLLDAGFRIRYPELDGALEAVMGRRHRDQLP